MDRHMDGRVDERMDRWMDGRMDGWTVRQMDKQTDGRKFSPLFYRTSSPLGPLPKSRVIAATPPRCHDMTWCDVTHAIDMSNSRRDSEQAWQSQIANTRAQKKFALQFPPNLSDSPHPLSPHPRSPHTVILRAHGAVFRCLKEEQWWRTPELYIKVSQTTCWKIMRCHRVVI